MSHFKDQIEELAFKLDKKILHLSEEDHFRMDLHPIQRLKYQIQSLVLESRAKTMSRFAITAFAIFAALFLLSNAPAYSKIIAANLFETKPSISEETQNETQTQTESLALLDPARPFIEDSAPSFIDLTPSGYENRVRIPSIGVNHKIVKPDFGLETLVGQDWNELDRIIADALENGIVHYPGTASPGEKGNVFLTAHSSNVFFRPSPYNTTFARLPEIKEGADIFVTYGQKEFHYKVTSKREVKPSNVSVLEQGDKKAMTLMTCTPVGTTINRLVVSAELVEES